jgi:hypothetical protein
MKIETLTIVLLQAIIIAILAFILGAIKEKNRHKDK